MLNAALKMDDILLSAEQKAMREGYDQVIFKNRHNGYEIRRTTNCRVKKSKIVGYMRLIYRDNRLSTRLEEN